MWKRMRKARRLRGEKGQGMTEYIIIVALIAIAAIGVVTMFGQNIRALFGAATTALSGNTAVSAQTTADTTGHTRKTINAVGQDNGGF